MRKYHKTMLEKSILMVPLFIAFVWMGFLVFNVQSPTVGMKLAPSRLDSLVNALFGFIVVYAIVLVYLFLNMNKKVTKAKSGNVRKKSSKPSKRKKTAKKKTRRK